MLNKLVTDMMNNPIYYIVIGLCLIVLGYIWIGGPNPITYAGCAISGMSLGLWAGKKL